MGFGIWFIPYMIWIYLILNENVHTAWKSMAWVFLMTQTLIMVFSRYLKNKIFEKTGLDL